MAMLALYTCPVLVRAPGDPGHAAFTELDGAIARDLADAPPPGLVALVAPLRPPPRWPSHALSVPGTPKPTLSVWQGLEAAFAYSYGAGRHREALRRRREWFAAIDGPVYVLWYASELGAVGHEEAVARLERLARDGPGPAAFDFRQPYDPDGRALGPRRLAALRRGADERPGRGPVPLPLREPER